MPFSGLPSGDLNINSPGQVIISPVTNLNLNPTNNLQINGANGLTLGPGSIFLVTGVAAQTLQYKDWSGNNASLGVVTSVGVRNSGWSKGILTS